jgi:hypothetical protein
MKFWVFSLVSHKLTRAREYDREVLVSMIIPSSQYTCYILKKITVARLLMDVDFS